MKKRQSLLHLLIGQEILWLLMVTAIIGCIIGMGKVMSQDKHKKELIRLGVTHEELEDIVHLARALKRKEIQQDEIRNLRAELERIKRLVGKTSTEEVISLIKALRNRIAELRKRLDKPPIITLTDAAGYYFESGKSELSDAFRQKLTHEIAAKLADLARRYRVDVIEIIGHTDEAPLVGRTSNLDMKLISYLKGGDVSPEASDNVGLGMARASVVARVLLQDEKLNHLTIIPYSAGQVVLTNGRLSHGLDNMPATERRRIEIRMKRSKDENQ